MNLQILCLPPYQLQYQPSQRPEERNACQQAEQKVVKSVRNTGSFAKPFNEILQNFLNFPHDSFFLNCLCDLTYLMDKTIVFHDQTAAKLGRSMKECWLSAP